MGVFDEREFAEEAKFKHQLELNFKIRNRRNKLFGLWIAKEHLGLEGDAALEYAKEVILSDFEGPGHEDMLDKVKKDLAARNIEISDHILRKHLAECEEKARESVMQE